MQIELQAQKDYLKKTRLLIRALLILEIIMKVREERLIEILQKLYMN